MWSFRSLCTATTFLYFLYACSFFFTKSLACFRIPKYQNGGAQKLCCKNFGIKISILSTRSYYFDIQYRIRIVYHFNLFVMLKLGIYLFKWNFGVSQCWRYYFYLKEFNNLVSTSKEYIIWSELLHSHKWLVNLWYFCKMKMLQSISLLLQ